MTELRTRLAELRRRKAELEAEETALCRELAGEEGVGFRALAQSVFDAHPRLESFNWTQYTPYFNDGDECIFGANTDEDSIGINDLKAHALELQEFDYIPDGHEARDRWGYVRSKYRKEPNKRYDPELAAARKAVAQFLAQFEADELKRMFGDHVCVTIRRDGRPSVDSHEHE